MSKSELTEKIVRESRKLSKEKLEEVLDFVQFLKLKEMKLNQNYENFEQHLSEELKDLDKTSLIHLEEEFENYKEIFPHE